MQIAALILIIRRTQESSWWVVDNNLKVKFDLLKPGFTETVLPDSLSFTELNFEVFFYHLFLLALLFN